MLDLGALLASLAVALLVLVMLSFAIGTQRNIRTGNARLAWLQDALPRLGSRTTLRWLGSSAVQLDLVDPAPPFRDVTVLYVLEPRDVPLLWLVTRAAGRRDVLIFRTSLRRAPRLELEAAAPASWIKASDADEAASWSEVAFPDGSLATAIEGADPADVAAARRAWERLAAASAAVWRLSIRRTVPHLEVHVRPAEAGRVPAERVVQALRDLAVELSRT
jgi:hypothetical protein